MSIKSSGKRRKYPISKRADQLSPSGIRRFFDLLASAEGVISLGVGEPDYSTPWHISEAAIETRVLELAEQISKDYEDCDELVLVGVLKGAFIFLADLSRQLTIPRVIEFIAVSSYGSGSRSRSMR